MTVQLDKQEGLVCAGAFELYVRREGSGPPLLFLGGSSFDMSLRAPVFSSALVQHFAVAAFEPRGLARSGAPDGEWCMADYASDALAVMDSLGWQRADVIGESFGGMTALELAIRHPHRVNRLAIVVAAPGGAGGSSYPIEEYSSAQPREQAIAALRIQDARFDPFNSHSSLAVEAKIQERMQFTQAFFGCPNNALGHPRLLKARSQHDCWDRLDQIKAQCTVISGRFDNQAPAAYGAAMAKRIAGAKFLLIEGGHSLCFAEPETIGFLLREWGASLNSVGCASHG
jgi:3-oxoadipate enol-lactonase